MTRKLIIPEWCRPGAACTQFGISVDTLNALDAGGHVRVSRLGKSRLINIASLRALIERTAQGGNPPAGNTNSNPGN